MSPHVDISKPSISITITKPETSKRLALTSLLDLKYPCFR